MNREQHNNMSITFVILCFGHRFGKLKSTAKDIIGISASVLEVVPQHVCQLLAAARLKTIHILHC